MLLVRDGRALWTDVDWTRRSVVVPCGGSKGSGAGFSTVNLNPTGEGVISAAD